MEKKDPEESGLLTKARVDICFILVLFSCLDHQAKQKWDLDKRFYLEPCEAANKGT